MNHTSEGAAKEVDCIAMEELCLSQPPGKMVGTQSRVDGDI